MTDILATLKHGHPRLIATAGVWDAINERRRRDPLLDGFLTRGEREARAIVTVAPVTYHKDGKRLLRVSRIVLRRVLLLALHFHLTGDQKLAARAEQEMRAAGAFSDWNPSHFLDVAEMTAALAFGYDWLYEQLSLDARTAVVAAIVTHGLTPGLTDTSGANASNNWNAVCLSGLSLGALAVADEEPDLAAQILDRTRTHNPKGMTPYAPSGVYPEGPMYWGYGTTFESVLLAALGSALGTDWGLSRSPGFLESGPALLQLLGPSGAYYDFSDGVECPETEPAMWWFAHTLQKPGLLRYDRARLAAYAADTGPPQPMTEAARLLPLAALWWPDDWTDKADAGPLHYFGPGPVPVAAFRAAWDDAQAMYLALKGGAASQSHGHMDAGSFVFEADGVRWGRDLGMQDYLSLESQGVDLWNPGQDSQRWDVFRLGPFSHSTLTIDGQRHCVDGRAEIARFADTGEPGAIVDLTPVFAGLASRVTRGFAFRPGRHVLIRDEIEGLTPGAAVRWAMLTDAEIGLDASQAILRRDGQSLRVVLQTPNDSPFEIIPADQPRSSFDAPNPGAKLLVANLTAPSSGRLTLSVILQPGSLPADRSTDPLAQTDLRSWPQPPTG